MKHQTKTNLILLIIIVAFLLIFMEGTVRMRDSILGFNFFNNSHRNDIARLKKPILPYRIFGNMLYVNKNDSTYISSCHNELYPLKKSNNTYRIVCFGGSTSQNNWTFNKFGIHYPLVLQRLLKNRYLGKNIEVINVSYAAYATTHSIILLEFDVISWKPDLIILMHNHNDLTVTYWPGFSFDYSNKYGTEYYSVPDYLKYYTPMNVLFQWSSLYWFIKGRIDRVSNIYNPKDFSRKSYGIEPPELSQYIFRRNLITFHGIADIWNIPVIFSSQPFLFKEEVSEFIADNEYRQVMEPPLQSEYISHHRLFNKIIEVTASSTGAYFLDNYKLFEGDSTYFIDGLHYNKAGVEKLAQNFYGFITSKNFIQ